MTPPAETHADDDASTPPDEDRPAPQRLELAIAGMTCSHCAAAVTRALSESPGVRSAHVDLAAGRAVVRGDALNAQQLIAAVEAVGYTAKIV